MKISIVLLSLCSFIACATGANSQTIPAPSGVVVAQSINSIADSSLNDKTPITSFKLPAVENNAVAFATPLKDNPVKNDSRRWSVAVNYGDKLVFSGTLAAPQADGYRFQATKTTSYLSEISKENNKTLLGFASVETGVKIFSKLMSEALENSDLNTKIFLDFEYSELLGIHNLIVEGNELQLPNVWTHSLKGVFWLPASGEPGFKLNGLKADNESAVVLTISPLF